MTKNSSNLLIINVATLAITLVIAIFFSQLKSPDLAIPDDKLKRGAANLSMKRDAAAIYEVLAADNSAIRSLQEGLGKVRNVTWALLALLALNAGSTLYLCFRAPQPEKSVVPLTE